MPRGARRSKRRLNRHSWDIGNAPPTLGRQWRRLPPIRRSCGETSAPSKAFLAIMRPPSRRLRKFAALKVSPDDAVEAEALAQLLAADSQLQIDELSITYLINNAETVQEKLAADRRIERLPLDTSAWSAQNEPPPRAAYSLLDRAVAASGLGITLDQIPQQLGQMLLFGKQTDRPARLELAVFRPDLDAAKKLLQDVLGDDLKVPTTEVVIGHMGQIEHALSWHWRLPDDTPEELRHSLSIQQRRKMVLEQWPKLPQPLFGGRTAEQAATEPQYRNRLLAAIWLLQLADADTGPDTYNELRRKLGLPELTDIDPAGLDLNRIPLGRIARLRVESLTDEQLKQAFNRAVVANFALALRRLAPEVLKRPNLPAAEYKLSAYRALVRIGGQRRGIAAADRRGATPGRSPQAIVGALGPDGIGLSHPAQRRPGRVAIDPTHSNSARPRTGRGPGAGATAGANRTGRSRRPAGDWRRSRSGPGFTIGRPRRGQRARQTVDSRPAASRRRKEIRPLAAGMTRFGIYFCRPAACFLRTPRRRFCCRSFSVMPLAVLGALTSGSGAPSNGSPERIEFNRFSTFLAYFGEISNPKKWRPNFLATASVVPLPAKGSSTISPRLLQARIIRPNNCSGIWQPCHPARCLNVPATRGKYHVSSSA